MRICGGRRLCTLTPASPSGAAARHPELLSGWETNKRSQPVSPQRDDSKETAEGLKSASIKRTALFFTDSRHRVGCKWALEAV